MKVYVVLAALFLLASCAVSSETTVIMKNSTGSLLGTVYLNEVDNGLYFQANLDSISPGEHGFHIHEKGDCSSPDFKSAGGHFNPLEEQHGAHVGDLTNVLVGDDGKTESTEFVEGLTLDAVLGRAFVIHAGADDYTSQPSGAAGPRIACGVIQ